MSTGLTWWKGKGVAVQVLIDSKSEVIELKSFMKNFISSSCEVTHSRKNTKTRDGELLKTFKAIKKKFNVVDVLFNVVQISTGCIEEFCSMRLNELVCWML